MDSTSSPEPLCDIVIPIWNQPTLTARCLTSILEGTTDRVRLILMDNGSEQPTQELLAHFKKESPFTVLLIRNERNLGFIKATNQGIRAGKAPWVCLLNNDTVVTPGWLAEMLKVAEANPKLGLLNPTSNSLGFSTGTASAEEYAKRLEIESGRWVPLPTAVGFCLVAKRALLEEVGLLDESFGMGNFDDDDLSRRVQAKGYGCARVCASYVYHEEKASFRQIPGWEKAFDENRRIFESRWGRSLRILCDAIPSDVVCALLDQNHWLYLLCARRDLSSDVAARAQVSCLGYAGKSRYLKATLRVLTKRKKPFDLIISRDPSWSRWLRRLKVFIPGEILHDPSREEILELCQASARSR